VKCRQLCNCVVCLAAFLLFCNDEMLMLLQTPAERVKEKMKLQLSETGTDRLLILYASISLFLMPPFQSKAMLPAATTLF
jgi:hypothetical protein